MQGCGRAQPAHHGDRARQWIGHARPRQHRRGPGRAFTGHAQPVPRRLGPAQLGAGRGCLRRRVPLSLGERARLPGGTGRPPWSPAPGPGVEGLGARHRRRGGPGRPADRSRLPSQLQVPLRHSVQRVTEARLRRPIGRWSEPAWAGRRRRLVRRGGTGPVPAPLRRRAPVGAKRGVGLRAGTRIRWGSTGVGSSGRWRYPCPAGTGSGQAGSAGGECAGGRADARGSS